jgi:hypothetical protein
MRKLFKEIHEQPEHIRSIFMWVSVVITLAIVLTFTLPSTIHDTVALINPNSDIIRNSAVVKEDRNVLANALSEARANIGTLWSAIFGSDDDKEKSDTNTKQDKSVKVKINGSPTNVPPWPEE